MEEPKVKMKPKVKFHAKYANYVLPYKVVDPDTGKPVQKTNPSNGEKAYNSRGNPIFVTKKIEFATIEPKLARGFHSMHEWDPNDDSFQNQEIGKELSRLAKADNPDILDNEGWEKLRNTAVWREKRKTQDLEARLAEQEALNKTLSDKIKKYEDK